jgi:hypothetical protein
MLFSIYYWSLKYTEAKCPWIQLMLQYIGFLFYDVLFNSCIVRCQLEINVVSLLFKCCNFSCHYGRVTFTSLLICTLPNLLECCLHLVLF